MRNVSKQPLPGKKELNLFKRHPSSDNFVALKKARAFSRRITINAKRNHWNNFTSSLSFASSSAEVWKNINCIRGNRLNSFNGLVREDKLVTDPSNAADLFAAHFSSHFSSITPASDFPINSSISQKSYNLPLTFQEYNYAPSMSRDSAPGHDGIRISMIRNLPSEMTERLLQLFNLIWSTGVLPLSWKTSLIIPILKPGKSSSSLNNYRPIALSSVMGKLLERIINKRLSWMLYKMNYISSRQTGFRPKFSTLDHLVGMEVDIRDSFRQRKHVTSVFLDITRAFDLMQHSSIMESVYRSGLEGNMIRFIRGFLSDRMCSVKIRYQPLFRNPQGFRRDLCWDLLYLYQLKIQFPK